MEQAVLARHGNKVTAMNHLDSELEDDDDELQLEEFSFHELLQRPVIHLLLVIIINNPINKFFTFITIFTILLSSLSSRCSTPFSSSSS